MKIENVSILSALKSVIVALIITVISLMAFAFAYVYTDIPEGSEKIIVMVIAIVSVFLAGLIASRRARTQGLINGALAGAVYMGLLYLTGFLVFGNPIPKSGSGTIFIIGLISGALGGIIGVNLKFRRKK